MAVLKMSVFILNITFTKIFGITSTVKLLNNDFWEIYFDLFICVYFIKVIQRNWEIKEKWKNIIPLQIFFFFLSIYNVKSQSNASFNVLIPLIIKDVVVSE